MRHDRLFTKLQEAYEHILKEEQKPNFDALCESILLDEGIKDLAKKGLSLLGKTKNIAKKFIKSSWRPAVLLLLSVAAAVASDIDFSPYIDKLNDLFTSKPDIVDGETIRNFLSMLLDGLHEHNIPLEDVHQIVDQVDVFRNAGESVDTLVDLIYQGKIAAADAADQVRQVTGR